MKRLVSLLLVVAIGWLPTWAQMQQLPDPEPITVELHQTLRNGFRIDVVLADDAHIQWSSPWGESVTFLVATAPDHTEVSTGAVRYRTTFDAAGEPVWEDAFLQHPDGFVESVRQIPSALQVDRAHPDLQAVELFAREAGYQASVSFWEGVAEASTQLVAEQGVRDDCTKPMWRCIMGLTTVVGGMAGIIAVCGYGNFLTAGALLIACLSTIAAANGTVFSAGLACSDWDDCRRRIKQNDDPNPNDRRIGGWGIIVGVGGW